MIDIKNITKSFGNLQVLKDILTKAKSLVLSDHREPEKRLFCRLLAPWINLILVQSALMESM